MNNRLFLPLCIALLSFSCTIFAQSISDEGTTKFTLFEIIDIAGDQSTAALRAETTKENRYWSYRQYRAQYYPQLGFDGQFPNFTRTFDRIRQDDGSYDFLPVSVNSSDINFRLSQNLAMTGGSVFVNSRVARADNFDTDETIYSGNPVEVGIIQPLFSFNRLKWDQRIEPLRFEESRKQYREDLEWISVNITERFFNLILAQISLEIAQKNLANNDTIFKIAQGRYNLGKIGEDELLQLELTLMNAQQQVEQANADLQTHALRLKSFAGMSLPGNIELLLPEDIPDFTVNEEMALAQARKNRADAVAFQRRKLQADSEIAQAKGNSGVSMDLYAKFGLSNRDNTIGELYSDSQNHQFVSLGFDIPIIDWGRRKSSVKTAEANQKLVQYSVAMDEINFEEEVLTQVRQLKMLRARIKITRKADQIADKRYEISKNRYLIGKIGITDLNIAMQEKDKAKRDYIQSLRDFWTAYYNLRRLTLYDFENNLPLKPVE